MLNSAIVSYRIVSYRISPEFCSSSSQNSKGYRSGGSRKKYLGAWPLIIWEATTAKRNYYRPN